MTTRDRLVAIGLIAAGILAGVWFLLVVPERKKATSLGEQVTTAQQSLSSAEEKLSTARSARSRYTAAYATVVRLGEAVPPSAQVPSLVYEIDQLSNSKHVDFKSITGSSSSSGASASSTSTTASATGGGTGAGFSQMPFSFSFSGGFFDLYNLFNRLDGLAVQTEAGNLQVSGRLLTIQSISLTAASQESKGAEGSKKPKEAQLTGTVTATAYLLPASQGLTAGATASGPASTASAAQPASSSSSGGVSTPAAVTRVTP
jgi:hypothetical protein